jgi:ATP-binding cassette subfamily B protein
MFKLRFTPDFRCQRDALLAQKTAPHIALPKSVEDCFAQFSTANGRKIRSQGHLWLEAMNAVRPLLWRAGGISLISSGCAAASTLAAMQLLSKGRDLSSMWLLSLIYFLMNCLAQVAIFNSGRIRCWVGLGVETHLVGLISMKLVRLSAAAAMRQSSGNLKTLITSDVKNIGQFLDNAVRNLLPALTALVVIAPLLIFFAGRSGVFGLVVMAAIIPLSLVLNAVSAHFQTKSQTELDGLTALVGEWVKNIRLVRYLSWDEAFRRDVSAGVRKFMTVSVVQHFMACLIFGLSMSWWMVSATGVIVVSRLLGYPLDLIGFFGSLWLLTFLNGYFTHLPNTIRLYGLATPSIARITRFLREDEQHDYLNEGEPIAGGAIPQKLIFENVGFKYPDGRVALRDLSIEFAFDNQLAIIGEIGSGKTTLLKLLCGEFPPTHGRILVVFNDGATRDLWTRPAYVRYRSHLAYVPQEAFVSSDLFHRNISLSDQDGDRDVMAAAYWAELEADLAALPQGLSEELGEGGVNLSGGQRQRLNLARAFFSRRQYMVLDDTLSAVDSKTEANLMQRLVSRGKGFVLVTHRTDELMRVDSVIVMRDGEIVERGEPKALASDPGSYFTRVLRAYESETIDA